MITVYSLSTLLPRHLDPRLVKEEDNLLVLIESLVVASRLVSGGDVVGAKQILGSLSGAPIPPSIRSLYIRMIEIIDTTSDYIATARSLINGAEAMIQRGDYDGAEKSIQKALEILSNIDLVLQDLQGLVGRVRLPEISQKILQMVEILSSAVKNLRERAKQLLDEIARRRPQAMETIIAIDAAPRSVWYGESILIRGSLTDRNGYALSNRSVLIHIGPRAVEAVTSSSGSFETTQRIDYYSKAIEIYAEYIPSGGDSGRYRYSRSESINISISYITPSIDASLNTTRAKPGEAVALNISLSHSVGVNIRSIFPTTIASQEENRVQAVIKIPENIGEGIYPIYVSTTPSGVIGPASWSTSIAIYRLDNNLRIDRPGYIFTGLTYTIRIYSEAPSEILVSSQDPGVSLSVNGSEIYIYVPNTYLGSSIGLVITAVPKDPGYRVGSQIIRITTYNTPVVAATGTIALSIIAAILIRRSSRHARQRPGEEALAEIEPEAQAPVEIDREGFSIIKAVQRLIEAVSGVPLRRSYTYREYLSMVAERLSAGLRSLVTRFFQFLERYVYGGPRYRGVLREIISIAEEILRSIGRAVGR